MNITIEEGLGILLALSVVIEITPIKINPWRWLLKHLGSALNADIKDELKSIRTKVDGMEKQLEKHREENKLEETLQCRRRILRFNDEILEGKKHSKEHYDDVLLQIDAYEQYCVDHPDFPNSRAVMSIENIKRSYQDCLSGKEFL